MGFFESLMGLALGVGMVAVVIAAIRDAGRKPGTPRILGYEPKDKPTPPPFKPPSPAQVNQVWKGGDENGEDELVESAYWHSNPESEQQQYISAMADYEYQMAKYKEDMKEYEEKQRREGK